MKSWQDFLYCRNSSTVLKRILAEKIIAESDISKQTSIIPTNLKSITRVLGLIPQMMVVQLQPEMSLDNDY